MKNALILTAASVLFLSTGIAPASADERDHWRPESGWQLRLERAQIAAHQLERAARELYAEARERSGRRLTRQERVALAEVGDLVRSADRLHARLERGHGRVNRGAVERDLQAIERDHRNAARAIARLHDRGLFREFARVDIAVARLDAIYHGRGDHDDHDHGRRSDYDRYGRSDYDRDDRYRDWR